MGKGPSLRILSSSSMRKLGYLQYIDKEKLMQLMDQHADYEQTVAEATEIPIAYAVVNAFNGEKMYCGNRCKRNTWTCNGESEG